MIYMYDQVISVRCVYEEKQKKKVHLDSLGSKRIDA